MDQLQLIDAALSVNRNLLQNGLFLYLWEQEEERMSQKKRRSVWVIHWLVRRSEFGIYEQLMKELREEDLTGFKNFLRVSRDRRQAYSKDAEEHVVQDGFQRME